ncbi:MAG: metal ABC transporter ATP-binding protein [Lachnospiraceae bacterium]|nr:metal ABC transporter ATP-binding protein [Lachnospiraceae bacterium]
MPETIQETLNTEALISCQNLTLGYEGKIVINDLSFIVNHGDYLCITGQNGSGKSTLMKTLLGLKTPMSGQIIWGNGIKATEIGYLPQQTQIQKDFPATVREVVYSGLINRTGLRPFYTIAEKAIAEKNMRKLGIGSLAGRCYRELSGGQQQRALLARALCATRKILLLDEPVAGLDPQATLELYTIIKTLNDEGITIIMISHDIDNSVSFASNVLDIGAQQSTDIMKQNKE